VRYVSLKKPLYTLVLTVIIRILLQTVYPATAFVAAQAYDSRQIDLSFTKIETNKSRYDQGTESATFLCEGGKSLVRFGFRPISVGTATAIRIKVHNDGSNSLRLFAQLNNSFWVIDYSVIPPHADDSIVVYVQRKEFEPKSLAATYPGMNGVPGGQMSLWADADIDATDINELTLFTIDKLKEPARVAIKSIETISDVAAQSGTRRSDRLVVDEFGQYSGAIWPGKVRTKLDLKEAAEKESLSTSSTTELGKDQYGGWEQGPQLKSTGRFRVAKLGETWWFVDPDGKLFWSDGVTGVTFTSQTDVAGRPQLFHEPPLNGDFLGRNLAWKYGADWSNTIRDRSIDRLRAWGLNTIGPWSDSLITSRRKMPYTLVISSKDQNGRIDPYSTAWQENLRKALTAAQPQIERDPWCIGVFVDNEIHETDPHWWKAYYTVVERLMKEVLPATLYLGSRLDYSAYPEVDDNRKQIVEIAAKHTDVLSFNLYRYTLEDFQLPKDIDHPVIIGEFHFGGLDRGMQRLDGDQSTVCQKPAPERTQLPRSHSSNPGSCYHQPSGRFIEWEQRASEY
jgi:hypothetical protein